CSTPTGEAEESLRSLPQLNRSKLKQGGWIKVGTRRDSFKKEYLGGLVKIKAIQNTVIHEDKRLRRSIRQKTLGNLNQSLSIFFATQVNFSPNLADLPLNIGVAEVVNATKQRAKNQFKKQLRKRNLSNVHQTTSKTLQVNTGESADLIRYKGQYSFDKIRVPVTNNKQLIIPSSSIDVAGWLAVWHHAKYLKEEIGEEDFEKTIQKELTGAITVTVEIDMGLRPQKYQKELFNLMRSVH
ncbi:MAG: hypothetical protein ABEI13_02255, partial [Candidatus Paceibacteria bacterium]